MSGGDPERVPVIVGVGQVNDRPADPDGGLDSLKLMEAALRRADGDAGGGWLGDLDSLSTVDQISCPHLGELAGPLAKALGASPARLETTPLPHGESPIRLLSEAANRIGSGETRIAAVVGGEAMRTATALARRAAEAGGPTPDILRNSPKRQTPDYRRRYGIVAPVDLYPLYENATRAAWGQSLAEGQAESAAIWSIFSEVAEQTPHAWIRDRVSADEILTPSARNRPIAHPYTKLMVANSSVNQGAGFIVTSLAEARRRGVPHGRLVHVGHGAAAREPAEVLARERFDRSAALEVALQAALRFNGLRAEDLAAVELYSCFPCVPKMARRILGWPVERPASVFGGLTFGGGPIANYMSHAVACMVERLRGTPNRGLLFGNGGILTGTHVIVLSGTPVPEPDFPRGFDVQAEADATRGEAPALDETYAGPGRIETYTVRYDPKGQPIAGIVVARTPSGARTLASVPAQDDAGLRCLTSGESEPVGATGDIRRREDGLQEFAFR